jgi:NCS2 family nucleobase:cation symporter-2
MTKVVNRFAIMTGAAAMIIAGMFPPIGAFFASLPDPVLGGCTIMMFGSIMVSGIQMMGRLQMTQRNATIAALSFSIGIGTTTATENAIWHIFPQAVMGVITAITIISGIDYFVSSKHILKKFV